MELNKQQLDAIQSISQPTLIVAGPGAGKTRVIVEKIIYLVKEKRYKPEKIFVSTFTVKASDELKHRLRKELGDSVENMQIGTFHSFCQTMLETYSNDNGFGTSFRVLDEEEQYALISNFANYGYRYGLKDIIKPVQVTDLINIFNKITENAIDSYELIEYVQEEPNNDDKEKRLKIAEAYDKYIGHLKDLQLMDFANLQKEFLNMIEDNSEILSEIKKSFDYYLIDEYQDTNPIQNEILKLLVNPENNITCVGDEDQSIYSFRNATVENFRNFHNDFSNSKEINLETNYRSTKDIIDLSNNFIKENRTYEKKIGSNRDSFNKPLIIKGVSFEDEAEKVVKFILNLKENNKIQHFGDVAVLFKSVRYHSKEYVEMFNKFEIPFEIKGDGSLLNENELKTIIYLMAYLKDFTPNEKIIEKWDYLGYELLFNNVLNLNEKSIEIIRQNITSENLDELFILDKLKDLNIDKEDIRKLMTLKKTKEMVIKKDKGKDKYSLTDLFYDVLRTTGYLNRLFENTEDLMNEIMISNLGELSLIINKYENNVGNNFKNFIYYLTYLPEEKKRDSASNNDGKSVKIMTIHQSKGLQFPVVIMGTVTFERYNKKRPKFGEFFEIPNKLMMLKKEPSEEEEKKRLFYVAMTRAQDLLVFATTDGTQVSPSTFLTNDIGINNLQSIESFNKKLEKTADEPDKIKQMTYSAVNNYLSCPFRFKLNYEYGFQTKPTYFQNYGIVVHNVLHKFHIDIKNNQIVERKLRQRVREIVISCWMPVSNNSSKDEKLREHLIEELVNYYRNVKDDIKEIVEIEKPFSYIDSNIVIKGRLDLMIKNKDDKIELWDFKARNVENIDDTFVKEQLKMYNIALQNQYNIDNLIAYTFKDNMKTPFDNSQKELDKTKKLLNNIKESIIKNKFERNLNSKFCNYCDYRFLCYKNG